MDMEDYLDLHEQMCKQARELSRRKGEDYSGPEDNLGNFKNTERVGICSAETGIMVRIQDKVSRLTQILDKGTAVDDETVNDTLIDLLNYSILLAALLEENKGEQEKETEKSRMGKIRGRQRFIEKADRDGLMELQKMEESAKIQMTCNNILRTVQDVVDSGTTVVFCPMSSGRVGMRLERILGDVDDDDPLRVSSPTLEYDFCDPTYLNQMAGNIKGLNVLLLKEEETTKK